MKTLKKLFAVTLVCLFVLSAVQIAVSAQDDTTAVVVGAEEMYGLTNSFGEFLLLLPGRLVHLLFTAVKAPFYFFGKIFGF